MTLRGSRKKCQASSPKHSPPRHRPDKGSNRWNWIPPIGHSTTLSGAAMMDNRLRHPFTRNPSLPCLREAVTRNGGRTHHKLETSHSDLLRGQQRLSVLCWDPGPNRRTNQYRCHLGMWWRSRRLTHTYLPSPSPWRNQVWVSAPTVVCLHINTQCASKHDVAFQVMCKVRDLMAKTSRLFGGR